MMKVIKAARKTAIPFTAILCLSPQAQQLLGWSVLLLASVVVIVAISLIVFVSVAFRYEKVPKVLISLIKAVKH